MPPVYCTFLISKLHTVKLKPSTHHRQDTLNHVLALRSLKEKAGNKGVWVKLQAGHSLEYFAITSTGLLNLYVVLENTGLIWSYVLMSQTFCHFRPYGPQYVPVLNHWWLTEGKAEWFTLNQYYRCPRHVVDQWFYQLDSGGLLAIIVVTTTTP